jgi:hypothetical protein
MDLPTYLASAQRTGGKPMRQRIRSRLTFANVVSLIALFVALGGTATAALIITSNSQVAPNTISGHGGSAAQ